MTNPRTFDAVGQALCWGMNTTAVEVGPIANWVLHKALLQPTEAISVGCFPADLSFMLEGIRIMTVRTLGRTVGSEVID